MGEISLSRRDTVPLTLGILRPMLLRDGARDEFATSREWTQPSFGLPALAEPAMSRLPSIREV